MVKSELPVSSNAFLNFIGKKKLTLKIKIVDKINSEISSNSAVMNMIFNFSGQSLLYRSSIFEFSKIRKHCHKCVFGHYCDN